MSLAFRDGKLDLAIVAGPRANPWPSAGARALSAFCAEMGLTVGLMGGDDWSAHGVLPLPGTGGLILAEDPQHRIHRIHARAVVRFSAPSEVPEYFPGSNSEGVMGLSSAKRLLKEAKLTWGPVCVILGTSNRAFRFGADLLELGPSKGASYVYCVEQAPKWGAKNTSGWEVERRRFEMAGGKILEAKPVRLTRKSALVWDFRLEDAKGTRVLETARVVSAGPFRDLPTVREYPPGSSLYEIEQTAGMSREEDFEGWVFEEERARALGGKIVKALSVDLGDKKDELEKIMRRSRNRIKKFSRHRENPLVLNFQGKWLDRAQSQLIRKSPSVPQAAHKVRAVASIECFEEIGCNLCEKACPESAIKWNRDDNRTDASIGAPSGASDAGVGTLPRVLIESDCTACGLCLTACPSGSTFLLQETEGKPTAEVTLMWRGNRPWKSGEFGTLVNRKGDSLGSGRVVQVTEVESGQWLKLEVPEHLSWEARGIRRTKSQTTAGQDSEYIESVRALEPEALSKSIDLTLNGDKRLVREKIAVSVALFEMGQARSEDKLLCRDGSCGMCSVWIDGTKKLACQTSIHRGMAIRMDEGVDAAGDWLCACMKVSRAEVLERIEQGKLKSPEAVVSATHVGQGKCHGQCCIEPLKRILIDQGIDATQWIDWRFPWREWPIYPSSG